MKTLRTLDLCRDYTRWVQNKLQGKTVVVVSSVHDWTRVNTRLNEMGKVQGIYHGGTIVCQKTEHD